MKLCKDCKHFQANEEGNDGECRSPQNVEETISPVTGEKQFAKIIGNVAFARTLTFCGCTKEGKWFEEALHAGIEKDREEHTEALEKRLAA